MSIKEKVEGMLCELTGVETVESGSLLQEDLALDSLSMVMMLIKLEEVFNVELDESDMNPFDLSTVQSVIDMINKYVGDENE